MVIDSKFLMLVRGQRKLIASEAGVSYVYVAKLLSGEKKPNTIKAQRVLKIAKRIVESREGELNV